MKIIVLGAGVVGVTSAWYLAAAGHEVTVIDRQGAAGMETSFANGAQISVSHAEPWANPTAPLKILQWLGREDAPLLFRPRADPAQWLWGLRFLRECLPWRTHFNTEQAFAIALYSRAMLQQLRAETSIEYQQNTRGILHFYTEPRLFERAASTRRCARRMSALPSNRHWDTHATCRCSAAAPLPPRMSPAMPLPSRSHWRAWRLHAVWHFNGTRLSCACCRDGKNSPG